MKSMQWFRFYSETADDRKFAVMARALQIPKYALIGIWAVLECRASQSPERGYLLVTLQKRCTVEDLADDIQIDPRLLGTVLSEFIDMGMIDVQDDVFHLSNWEKRQYSSDNSSERVKKHRMKQQCNVTETVAVTSESVSVSDSSLIKDSDFDDEKTTSPGELAELEQAFTAAAKLPVLSGGEVRSVKAYRAMKDAGVTPDDITRAVDILRDKQYRITGPSSIVNTAVSLAGERLRNAEQVANVPQGENWFYG